ncbi:hypothetical protein MP228_008745 [Amoeboaphelidium protococcarum]|nr:hypothetical protein MP228_008745 [Amoeboaphelidium protococcarum]
MTTEFKSKIVVRRLPPNLPESAFKTTIQQWMSRVNYFRYCPGSLVSEGVNQHSRAYLNFVDSQSVIEFSRVFNGWQFRNKQGQVHVAVVEYAPCQDVPLGDQVVDDANKIMSAGEFEKHASESMPDYMKFILNLKDLSQGVSPLYAGISTEIADKKTEPVNEEKLPVKTPLLQFITQRISSKQSKKSRKKDKKKKSGATKDSINKQKSLKQGSQNSKQTKDTQKQSQSENNQKSPPVTSGSQPARGSVLQIPSEKRQNRGRGKGRGGANVGGNMDGVQSIPNSLENTLKQQQQQQQKQQKRQDTSNNKSQETSDTQHNHPRNKSQRGRGRGRGRGGGPKSDGPSEQT